MLITLLLALTLAPMDEPAAAPPAAREPVIEPVRWLRRPSAALVNKVYPTTARKRGKGAEVVMSCTVGANGRLASCQVVSETPAGWGFGEAALRTKDAFQMTATTTDGQSTEGALVRIPLRFSPN